MALEAGLTPGAFWHQTPYETRLAVEAASARRQAEYRLGMWTAWHTAAFSRVKRMPRLDRLMRRLAQRRVVPQPPEKVWEAFKQANARLGGDDRRRGTAASKEGG